MMSNSMGSKKGLIFLLAFFTFSSYNLSSQSIESISKEIIQNMVLVEGGHFEMGCTSEQGNMCSNDEYPVHKVKVDSFYILSHEFIQEWWYGVRYDNPSSFCRGGSFPVENVSFDDVKAFIEELNLKSGLKFRLPTEAEWEYSARGGNLNCGFMYSGGDDPNDVSWNSKNSNKKTSVAKLKKPNNLGIYDLSGNVWEWVDTPYKLYRIQAVGATTYTNHYVIRGGSYAGSPNFCRNSIRYHYATDFKSSFIGFRLAMNVADFPLN